MLHYLLPFAIAIQMAFVPQSNSAVEPTTEEKTEIQWMTIEEAIAANAKSPKKIFIDVYTDWCGWCKRMDAATFQHPKIATYMNAHYYNVKFDAEQKDSVVFKGQTFRFVAQGRRGYHELAAALLQNQLSYPTVVFLDESMNMLSPVPGYQPPSSFEPIMKFFGEEAYKSTSWDDYQKNFVGEIPAQ